VRDTWLTCGEHGGLRIPGIRRLVVLTLVLGTHMGKLYFASSMVLSLRASCSWDGHTHERPLQLNPSPLTVFYFCFP
jgi:hypothetical protein